MALAAAGLLHSSTLAASPPPYPNFNSRDTEGEEGSATPASPLPSTADGRMRERRRSVPPPRGHPLAAASFVAVILGWARGAQGRKSSRTWNSHWSLRVLSAALQPSAVPRRGRPDAVRVNNPLSGSQVADAIVRPETPDGGDSSPLLRLLPRGKNPGEGSGPVTSRGTRKRLWRGPRCSRASVEGPDHRQDTER